MKLYLGNTDQLSQDKFSNSIFGEKGQLKILGHFQEGYKKSYIVECSICSCDPDLFGKGLFISALGHLKALKMPCGCSQIPKWNEDQQYLNTQRACIEMGYTLIGKVIGEQFTGQSTKIEVYCSEHGIWNTTIRAITNCSYGCRKCADTKNSINNRIDDSVMIADFFSTKVFHPDTIFYRSERATATTNQKNYWWIECPVCNSKGEAISTDLKRGAQPCECFNNQRQSYVNLVSDEGTPIAIKFGIAKAYKTRVQKQNKKSVYEVTNLKVWEFSTRESCIRAELECKQSFDCGVVSRDEMSDGYSETTHIYNLDKISEIFEKHGGIAIH